jgi:hypothetical protein
MRRVYINIMLKNSKQAAGFLDTCPCELSATKESLVSPRLQDVESLCLQSPFEGGKVCVLT